MTHEEINKLEERPYVFKIGDRGKGITARYDKDTDAVIFPRAVFDYVITMIQDALNDERKDWISVTDDLPDEEGEYLIAWKGKLGMTEDWGRTFLEIADYHKPVDLYDTDWDVQHIYDRGWTDVKVLAWMPLPKFYEE